MSDFLDAEREKYWLEKIERLTRLVERYREAIGSALEQLQPPVWVTDISMVRERLRAALSEEKESPGE